MRVVRPELRIVSPEAWAAVQARLVSSRAQRRSSGGRRRRDIDAAYLLSGFARCAVCGGSVAPVDRRAYGCIRFHKLGATQCGNALRKPIAALDAAVVRRMRELLTPASVRQIIDALEQEFSSSTRARDLTRYRRELATVETKIQNLTNAIAEGGS